MTAQKTICCHCGGRLSVRSIFWFGYNKPMDETYQRKVTELINKSEITSAVSTYFRALDEKRFDTEHSILSLRRRRKEPAPTAPH
jgi:hypothetical protein